MEILEKADADDQGTKYMGHAEKKGPCQKEPKSGEHLVLDGGGRGEGKRRR